MSLGFLTILNTRLFDLKKSDKLSMLKQGMYSSVLDNSNQTKVSQYYDGNDQNLYTLPKHYMLNFGYLHMILK